MSDPQTTLVHVRDTAIDLAMRFGPRLVVAIVIMVLGSWAASAASRGTTRALKRFELEPPVEHLFVRLTRAIVLLGFLAIALQNLGVELLPLFAGVGVAGAGIALAAKGVLSNIVAGLTIIFTKPYRVGDYIEVVGVEGQVQSITIFSTVLIHTDQSRVVVPNRKVVGEILHNYGRMRQVTITARIAYDADLPAALAVVKETVAANPRVLPEPAPVVQIGTLADSAVEIVVKPWTAVPDAVPLVGELNLAVAEALRARSFTMPFPQRVVRMVEAR